MSEQQKRIEYDELHVSSINKKNFSTFTDYFEKSEFPVKPNILIIHDEKTEDAIDFIVDYVSQHYLIVMCKKPEHDSAKVVFVQTIH